MENVPNNSEEILKGLDDVRCLVRSMEVSDKVANTSGVFDMVEPYTTKIFFVLDQLRELVEHQDLTWSEQKTEFLDHFKYSELSMESFENGYVITYHPPGGYPQCVVSTIGEFNSKSTSKVHGKRQLNWLKKHPQDVESLLRTV